MKKTIKYKDTFGGVHEYVYSVENGIFLIKEDNRIIGAVRPVFDEEGEKLIKDNQDIQDEEARLKGWVKL
jgi:uncharacterized secreted protein with C-terminal beta-propeller domain